MHRITVYRYGTDPRADVPAEVDEQLRLAHRLQNELVEIELAYERACDEVRAGYPQVAEAERRIAEAEIVLVDLVDQGKRERVADRSVTPRSSTAALIRQARAELREARQARKTAVAGVRDQCRDQMAVVADAKAQRVRDTYRRYCADGELYWATYNDVLGHHKTAVQRVIADRVAGRPARLRFHPWRGEGTIAVQLQRQAGMPPRTPELLASGQGRWRRVLQLGPWVDPDRWADHDRPSRRRISRTGWVRWCVGGGRQVTIPVVLHRMPPGGETGADVAEARLSVRRVAGRRIMSVATVMRVPVPAPVPDDRPVVTLWPRWSSGEEGDVVAAEWVASLPLRVPDSLMGVVHSTDGWSGQVVLPAAVRGRLRSADGIRSRRDQAMDVVRRRLVDALAACPVVGGPSAGDVARWRAPGRFAALTLRWLDAPPDGHVETAAMLERWRVTDRRRWEAEVHTRRRAVGYRRDMWRQVSAWLAGSVSRVEVVPVGVAALTRRPVVGADLGVVGVVGEVARSQRQDAAPSELVRAVLSACAREGVASGSVDSSFPGGARGGVDAGGRVVRPAS